MRLPQPMEIRVEDDGAVHATWCFGAQGAPDSWRVMMLYQPGEGFFASKLAKDHERDEEAEGDAVGPALARWLGSHSAKDPK